MKVHIRLTDLVTRKDITTIFHDSLNCHVLKKDYGSYWGRPWPSLYDVTSTHKTIDESRLHALRSII